LGVVNDCDFDAAISAELPAEQSAAEEPEVGDFFDDGLGDAASRVAQDGGVAKVEAESDLGGNSVVEAGDNDHPRRGQAEWYRGEGADEAVVVLK
jgi:hypothetical protein